MSDHEDERTPTEIEQLRERLREAEQRAAQFEDLEQEVAKLREAESAWKSLRDLNHSGSTKKFIASVVRNLNFEEMEFPETSKSPMGNPNPNSIPSGDNGMPEDDNETDTDKLSLYLLQEVQKLRSTMTKIPGMPPTLEKAGLDSYADSPFMDKIALADLSRKFTVPSMKAYDGSTDPLEHVAQYKQKMFIVPLEKDKREAGMCKGFGSTLTGPALQWFINIPNGSIGSFASLINGFNQQFASSRQLEKHSNDLLKIVQKPTEKSRDFLRRFNKEMISIPNCDVLIACEAFRQGVIRDSELYNELTKHPCYTFEDVQAKALAMIRLEEDRLTRAPRQEAENTNRKSPSSKTHERAAPYRRIGGKNEVNATRNWSYPSISEYNFTVNLAGLIDALKNMGAVVRWPQKLTNPDRDTSKFCDFHDDTGHVTEDCLTLKREVAFLIKKGYLTDLLPGNNVKKGKKDDGKPPPPPPPSKTVNFITGGSELCGLTHSAAKRIARDANAQPSTHPPITMDAITFDQTDADAISSVHHDALVIKLHIGCCMIGRVLVDGGSSVNIIMMSTLKEMGIEEKDLTGNTSALVGFSGEVAHTLGEINLPIYIEGVTTYEKFNVMDYLSSYNVLLGRPWIHNLKAIPSTYHQCIKIPTRWGVVTIKGETRAPQECYALAMKSTCTDKGTA